MLDIRTLMVLYLITNIINTGAVAVIFVQNRGRFHGMSSWLAGLALQALGPILIVLRGTIPDILSITLANTIMLAGMLTILIGLERFTGKKGRHIHNYVLLAVFIAVSAYFVLVQPNLMARNIALAATTIIITSQCCWLLLRRVDPGMRQVTRLTGIVFAAYAAFNLARIILTLLIPEQSNDFFSSGPVNSLALTAYILLNICLTVSLVLMVNRRLLTDVSIQEEKYSAAFHSSPYAIILTRPADGKIFEINEGFERITGYQYAETIGKTTVAMQLWDCEKDRLGVVDDLKQGLDVHAREYIFRKKTGELLTGLFSASVFKIGNEPYILSSIADISERKHMEEELKESEARFRHISALTSDIAYSCHGREGGDFSIDWLTGAVESITGYSIDEIKEHNCWRFIVAEDDLAIFDRSVTGLLPGAQGSCLLRIRCKNGGITWISSFAECSVIPQSGGPVALRQPD